MIIRTAKVSGRFEFAGALTSTSESNSLLVAGSETRRAPMSRSRRSTSTCASPVAIRGTCGEGSRAAPIVEGWEDLLAGRWLGFGDESTKAKEASGFVGGRRFGGDRDEREISTQLDRKSVV